METGAKIPSSLAKSCVRSIMQNIGSYRKSLKRKLAPPAREMVLDELSSDKRIKGLDDGFAFDKVWADLPFLLNSRTKEFTTCWLRYMLKYPVPSRPIQPILRQLLQHLSEQAPNLEYLELFFYWEDKPALHLDHRDVCAIGRMEKLTKLVFVHVPVKLADFRTLTIKCKNLQEISADTVEMEEKPTFSFDKFLGQEIKAREQFIEIRLRNDSSDGAISRGYRFLEMYLTDISQLSFMEKLTNLTRFKLRCYRLKEDMMEEFPYSLPSLDFAEINYSSGNVLRKFLEKNGGKLDKLYIDGGEAGENTSLAEIFDWCPKLKHLRLVEWRLFDDEIRIDCLQHLQHVEIKDGDEDEEYEWPELHLSRLLSAPNLKVVKICVWKCDFGCYRSIIEKITNREILTNLKFLNLLTNDFCAHYDESVDNYKPRFDGIERLVELENAIKLSR